MENRQIRDHAGPGRGHRLEQGHARPFLGLADPFGNGQGLVSGAVRAFSNQQQRRAGVAVAHRRQRPDDRVLPFPRDQTGHVDQQRAGVRQPQCRAQRLEFLRAQAAEIVQVQPAIDHGDAGGRHPATHQAISHGLADGQDVISGQASARALHPCQQIPATRRIVARAGWPVALGPDVCTSSPQQERTK